MFLKSWSKGGRAVLESRAAAAGTSSAAALAPAALALLTSTFPAGRARVRAFGVWSAMNAAGGALGALAGGLLTEHAGWRWVMFVNVPMALLLSDGYAFGLTLGAVLLVAAVLITLTVLRRTGKPEQAAQDVTTELRRPRAADAAHSKGARDDYR